MTVLYRLQVFEGPLDLLLHLIDRAEIDIRDIRISDIADQYFEYLAAMQEMELEVTSEFLVMAATLLVIKSRELLPKPPPPEPSESEEGEEAADPREELIRKLIEYRKYKAAAAWLSERQQERSLVFTREPMDLTAFLPERPANPVERLSPGDLALAFRKAMRRMADRTRAVAIRRYEISVKDRMRHVVQALKGNPDGRLRLFAELLGDGASRHEVVVTLLALLELMKRNWIACSQTRMFGEIVVTWTGSGEGEDGLPDDEIGA